MGAPPTKRLLGLEAKLVLGLLTIAAVPLVVSAILVGQIAQVASHVASGQATRLRAPLEHARELYRESVDARKDDFHKAALLLATDPKLAQLCLDHAPAAEVAPVLRALMAADRSLAKIAFVDGDRVVAAELRPLTEPMDVLANQTPLAAAPGCAIATSYVRPSRFHEDLDEINAGLRKNRLYVGVEETLPRSYRLAFLLLIGVVVMGTTAIAILIARRTTRRLDRLVAATRKVGEGNLDVRVRLSGNDELTDLSVAFDQMLADLEKSRAEIEYLEKIGAWQEVARRLAHEIKNPLTPIQLAIQQLHTKYDGGDARFQKLLDDVREIVTEEVAGLRRLVDDFRGFAKLPRVEAVPLDLAIVAEDVRREIDAVEIVPSATPAMVHADRLLLKRALVNLADNAREAGAKRIAISFHAAPETVTIIVDDDGPGVPAELRATIFDPYVTTKEHGTGLGLAIVKKTLLEHLGDVILAEAPSPLGGARFEITLPGYEASASPPAVTRDG